MDSMRSLNTSLPGTSPSKQQQTGEPPEQLLSAFKAAALSVTRLYKTAAADQVRARSDGYQDALDELLTFMDKENIGLNDGEGWMIRRWATERFDGRESVSQNLESDDEAAAERAPSPAVQRPHSTSRISPAASARSARGASPMRAEPPASTVELPNAPVPPQGSFTFRSSHSYPQDGDTILSDLDIADTSRGPGNDGLNPPTATNMPSGITITRPGRLNQRNVSHSSRINPRSANSIGNVVSKGSGQKRKLNLGEFFDFGNLGKDNSGVGGKRGRFA